MSVKTTAAATAQIPAIKKSVETVMSAADSVSKSVNTLVQDYRDQTNKAIEEKKKEKEIKNKPVQDPQAATDSDTNMNNHTDTNTNTTTEE